MGWGRVAGIPGNWIIDTKVYTDRRQKFQHSWVTVVYNNLTTNIFYKEEFIHLKAEP